MTRLCFPLLMCCAGCAGSAVPTSVSGASHSPEYRVAIERALVAGTSWTDDASLLIEPSTTCGTAVASRRARLSARVTVVEPGPLDPRVERVEISAFELDGATIAPAIVEVDRRSRAMTVDGAPVEGALARALHQLVDPGLGGGLSELGAHVSAFPLDAPVAVGAQWPPDRARIDPILTQTRSGHPWTGELDAGARLIEVAETPLGPAARIRIHTRVDTTDLGASDRVVREAHVTFDLEVVVPLDPALPLLEDRFEVNAEQTFVVDGSADVCRNVLHLSRTHRRSDIRTRPAGG